jgi:hypothetical protein
VIGMAIDNIKRTFWIYTSLYIYELCIQNEERDVWRIYLDKKQYNSALRYCKDPSQKDKVFKTQAKDYFHQKRFKMSAQIYANSTVPFEQVSLKFVDKTDALQVYLTNKLAHLTKQVE